MRPLTCRLAHFLAHSAARPVARPPGTSRGASPGASIGTFRSVAFWHVARSLERSAARPLARRAARPLVRPLARPLVRHCARPLARSWDPPGTSPDASTSASLATSHGVPLACPSGASLRRSINHRVRDTSWAEVLPELIRISNSFSSVSLSSFEELLSLSYAFRQLKLKIQISSVRI